MNSNLVVTFLNGIPNKYPILTLEKNDNESLNKFKVAAKESELLFVDIDTSTCEVEDFEGLPFTDKVTGEPTSFMPYWWPKDKNSKGVLFLNNVGLSSIEVKMPLFELIFSYRIEDNILPEGWRVVAAINSKSDNMELISLMSGRCFVLRED